MPSKFTIGDKVIIKGTDSRTPKYILRDIRLDHPRTIVATFYDTNTQHIRYYLGNNKRGDIDISNVYFRASQLRLWLKGKIGRPRTKRRYKRHTQINKGL